MSAGEQLYRAAKVEPALEKSRSWKAAFRQENAERKVGDILEISLILTNEWIRDC